MSNLVTLNFNRTYAKLRWLGVAPKAVQLHDEANTTTPASVLRKSYSNSISIFS